MIAGVALVGLGVVLNGTYLREALFFRGAARRGRSADRPVEEPPPPAQPRPPAGAG